MNSARIEAKHSIYTNVYIHTYKQMRPVNIDIPSRYVILVPRRTFPIFIPTIRMRM